MVVNAILACSSNNMLIPAYFNVKFCNEHPFNIYKVIQFFILLSDLQALISNVILEGKRSLNPPSTPSRLNFILLPLSFVHYHLSTTTPALTFSLPTSHVDSAVRPSPLLRRCGLKIQRPSELRTNFAPPLSTGIRAAHSLSTEVLEPLDRGIGE